MKITRELFSRLKLKAEQSNNRIQVAALGFNKKGECVIVSMNKTKISKKMGGEHAEQKIFRAALSYNIKTIVLIRLSRAGNPLPIEPCKKCKKIADRLGIKIIDVRDLWVL